MSTENTATRAFKFWSRPIVVGGFNVAFGLIQLVKIWGEEDLISKLGALLLGAGFILVGMVLIAVRIRPSWEFSLYHLSGVLVVAGSVLRWHDKGSLLPWGGGIVILALVVSFLIKLRTEREGTQTDQPR